MSTLKNKLAQKVEILECTSSDINSSNKLSNGDVPNATNNELHENVIMLKPQENNQLVSVIPEFAISINEAKQRISMLQSFVKEMMVINVDYGVIPKCDKPSLFKSGAEKLCDIFGFSKHIEITNRLEDWNKGLFHYEVKTILINKKTGLIEAEGIGSCNNRERKYKNQDSYSIINTLLKMAKKRALIDAVLSATRSSGIFTQDIEDLAEPTYHNETQISSQNNSTNKKHTQSDINASSSFSQNLIDKNQQNIIFSIIAEKKLPIDEMKTLMTERYQVWESRLLSHEQAEDFINFLKVYNVI